MRIVVAVAGAAALLAGCQSPVVATRSSAPAASAPAASVPAASAPAAPATAGAVTLSISQPISASGQANASVSCSSNARTYVATAASAEIEGHQVSFTARIAGYRGPGTYRALVTMRVDAASGVVTTVSGVPNVPATITADGGSFSVDATGEGGRTLEASVEWTCE